MKERIWLNIRELRLRTLCTIGEVQPEKTFRNRKLERKTDFSLDLGPFALHGMTVFKDGDHTTSTNGSFFNGRLLDVPLHHKSPGTESWPLLGDVILVAIYRRWKDWFSRYLNGDADSAELVPWQPEQWEGRELAIPIDFVEVTAFRRFEPNSPRVHAMVRLGRHAVLWQVMLADGDHFSLEDERRLGDAKGDPYPYAPFAPDGKIGTVLKEMWGKFPALRETVRRAEAGPEDHHSVFTLATRGAQAKISSSEVVPPRICFFDGEKHIPVEESMAILR